MSLCITQGLFIILLKMMLVLLYFKDVASTVGDLYLTICSVLVLHMLNWKSETYST